MLIRLALADSEVKPSDQCVGRVRSFLELILQCLEQKRSIDGGPLQIIDEMVF